MNVNQNNDWERALTEGIEEKQTECVSRMKDAGIDIYTKIAKAAKEKKYIGSAILNGKNELELDLEMINSYIEFKKFPKEDSLSRLKSIYIKMCCRDALNYVVLEVGIRRGNRRKSVEDTKFASAIGSELMRVGSGCVEKEYQLDSLIDAAYLTKAYKAGKCDGFAIVAYIYLAENTKGLNINLAAIKKEKDNNKDGHCVVLVKVNTEYRHVLDPWLGVSMDAIEYGKYLNEVNPFPGADEYPRLLHKFSITKKQKFQVSKKALEFFKQKKILLVDNLSISSLNLYPERCWIKNELIKKSDEKNKTRQKETLDEKLIYYSKKRGIFL